MRDLISTMLEKDFGTPKKKSVKRQKSKQSKPVKKTVTIKKPEPAIPYQRPGIYSPTPLYMN